jgi:hypothetical protein
MIDQELRKSRRDLFLVDTAGGNIGVLGRGGIDVAEIVLRRVGADFSLSRAGSGRIISLWV